MPSLRGNTHDLGQHQPVVGADVDAVGIPVEQEGEQQPDVRVVAIVPRPGRVRAAMTWHRTSLAKASSIGLLAVIARGLVQLGVNITGWTSGAYEGPAMEHSLAEAMAHGFNGVTFTPTWYTNETGDSGPVPDAYLTPTDASLVHAAAMASELGLAVTLKPHVDLPDYSRWRGELDPPDRKRWWSAYAEMIGHYADLAQGMGAAVLVVGTELERLTGPDDEAYWRELIDAVRVRFDGLLTYATNELGDPERVRFWDALDYIGVNVYPQLAVEAAAVPSPQQLIAAWVGPVGCLRDLHERWRRPLLITEIGYRSSPRALHEPGDWVRGGADDPTRQAAAYEAALSVLAGQRWIVGLNWWDWPSDLDGAAHDLTGYSPYGRPAAAVARKWNRRLAAVEPTGNAVPFVSIVVPVRDGEKTIRDCVEALLSSEHPEQRREIVVVDNGSKDRTAAIVRAMPVRYVHEARIGRSHARNRGVNESRGEIIAFTDADCIADPAWIPRLVEAFAPPEVSAVAGEILAATPRTGAQRFMAQHAPRWQSVVLRLPEPFAITANVAFRRQVFGSVGLFDPEFVTAEDVDFGWRFFAAGLNMVYAPGATVAHRLRPTVWQLFRQQVGLGYGRVLLHERHGVPSGYAIPTWEDIGDNVRAVSRSLRGRGAEDEFAFALYTVLVNLSLRTGAIMRNVVRSASEVRAT